MSYTEKTKGYSLKYAKEKLKRIPLDMQKTDNDNLVSISSKCGKSINGYIKEAIHEKIEREGRT